MKRILFCNEHIREKTPTGPVIAVLAGDEIVYCNAVTIFDANLNKIGTMRFSPEGFGDTEHEVRVAIELTSNAILQFPGHNA